MKSSLHTSRTLRLAAGLLATVAFADPAAAQNVHQRWDAPSTLTPGQAAAVLQRHFEGEPTSPNELFEARKQIRTDRGLQNPSLVLEDVAARMVVNEYGSEVRIRQLSPVISWQSSEYDIEGLTRWVRLRGETLWLIVLQSEPNIVGTLLLHETTGERYRLCGLDFCKEDLDDSIRGPIAYELDVQLHETTPGEARASSIYLSGGQTGQLHAQTLPLVGESHLLGRACDPLPSETLFEQSPAAMVYRHSMAELRKTSDPNLVFCGLFASSQASDAEFRYLVDGALAVPPIQGEESAILENPMSFALYED